MVDSMMYDDIKPLRPMKYTVHSVSKTGNIEDNVFPCFYYAWLLRTYLLESDEFEIVEIKIGSI